MRYNGLSYLIGEGFKNMFKNTKSTVISVITMICTMFLFGIFFAIGVNINSILEQVQLKQGMEIFIWDEVTDEQKNNFETEIKALEGVNSVRYKNKQQALDSFKESLGAENSKVLEGYENDKNIFPASYIVTLTDLEKSDEIQAEVRRIGAKIATAERVGQVDLNIEETTEHDSIIKNITSSDNTINTLITIVRGVRITIGVIFIILLVISITIISNTIKLTVHARRKEISIMKYVGATNGFIRWPFIVEGMIIGVFASAISITLVGIAYRFLAEEMVNSQFMQVINMSLVTFGDMFNSIIFVYMLLGIGIGAIGSVISMRKYLKV